MREVRERSEEEGLGKGGKVRRAKLKGKFLIFLQ